MKEKYQAIINKIQKEIEEKEKAILQVQGYVNGLKKALAEIIILEDLLTQ